jgi:hypothetical protein
MADGLSTDLFSAPLFGYDCPRFKCIRKQKSTPIKPTTSTTPTTLPNQLPVTATILPSIDPYPYPEVPKQISFKPGDPVVMTLPPQGEPTEQEQEFLNQVYHHHPANQDYGQQIEGEAGERDVDDSWRPTLPPAPLPVQMPMPMPTPYLGSPRVQFVQLPDGRRLLDVAYGRTKPMMAPTSMNDAQSRMLANLSWPRKTLVRRRKPQPLQMPLQRQRPMAQLPPLADWNAIAVMDALTGRCFVQSFQPRESEDIVMNVEEKPKLLVVDESARGLRISAIVWPDENRFEAFEYDIFVENPAEFQDEMGLWEAPVGLHQQIWRMRRLGHPALLNGSTLRQALSNLQVSYGHVAVWPSGLPPLTSRHKQPATLVPLEDILSMTSPMYSPSIVSAYIVCGNHVHAMFNSKMQVLRLDQPLPLPLVMAREPHAIRIFAPTQLHHLLLIM